MSSANVDGSHLRGPYVYPSWVKSAARSWSRLIELILVTASIFSGNIPSNTPMMDFTFFLNPYFFILVLRYTGRVDSFYNLGDFLVCQIL